MATRYIGMTSAAGPSLNRGNVIGAASGGTLAGAQNVQVVFDDAVFDSTLEGKQRLLAALDIIEQAIETARVWPITSST